MRVPWRPKVWGYEGRTVYRRDEEGLIFEHMEEWNVTWIEVFARTLIPDLASKVFD